MSSFLVVFDTVGITIVEIMALAYLVSARERCEAGNDSREVIKCRLRKQMIRAGITALIVTLIFMLIGLILISMGNIDAGFYTSRIPFYIGVFMALMTGIYLQRINRSI